MSIEESLEEINTKLDCIVSHLGLPKSEPRQYKLKPQSNNMPALNKIDVKCPVCQSAMVIRTNKQGGQFLGCTAFPNCRGSRPYGESAQPRTQKYYGPNPKDEFDNQDSYDNRDDGYFDEVPF